MSAGISMVIPDEIIRTKRKTIALIVGRDGRLIVRAPMRAGAESIQKFIAEKEKWIRTKQGHVKETYPPFVPKEYVNGEGFWYLGKIYKLQLGENTKPLLYLNGNFQLARTAVSKAPIAFERWYREQAYTVISERVQWYAAKHGFNYKQVKITSARARWGSCNDKGTLSFAWRLVMAPVPVIDYVVVHELMHLRVKNHSKKFWALIQILMPDCKKRIEWLEINGHLLNLE